MKFLAKTLFGLEDLLVSEILSLGGKNVQGLNRAVSFEGDLECLYRVNYESRLAIRILKPFLEFSAHNETVLYKRLRRYDWTQMLSLEQTFSIDSTVKSDFFKHSKYISLKTKDAIVDLFRLKNDGLRPSIDIKNPDFKINLHCNQKNFILSLDSSGESLHRRGYRQSDRQAPLNEILATGMILLSGWDKKKPFYDPMCGSGTLLTEAYAIANNIPPRQKRSSYGFMQWADFDLSLWQKVKAEADEKILRSQVKIFGSEIDETQYYETKSLLSELELSDIKLSHMDFVNSDPPATEGIIVCNPPYGERLDENDVELLYKNVGDTLKTNYSGWEAWIISSNKQALKRIGLRPSKKLMLYNGSLECKYHKYEMYKGSKKKKYQHTKDASRHDKSF